ncbi:MAG: hypothetical protein WDW36_002892 [Sanguina aurantia]
MLVAASPFPEARSRLELETATLLQSWLSLLLELSVVCTPKTSISKVLSQLSNSSSSQLSMAALLLVELLPPRMMANSSGCCSETQLAAHTAMESICAAAMEKGTALQLLGMMQRLEPSKDSPAVRHVYCMALTVQASSKPHQGHRAMACMAVSDSAALAVQAVTAASAFTASLQLALHRSQSAPLSKQLQTEFQTWWMALALLQRSMPDSSSEIADVQGRFGAGVLAAALHNLVLLADAAAGFDTAGGAQVLLHGSMPFAAMCGAMSCIKLSAHSLKEAASSVAGDGSEAVQLVTTAAAQAERCALLLCRLLQSTHTLHADESRWLSACMSSTAEPAALAAKRCKAAVRAMGKAGQHVQAMAASARYITRLYQASI